MIKSKISYQLVLACCFIIIISCKERRKRAPGKYFGKIVNKEWASSNNEGTIVFDSGVLNFMTKKVSIDSARAQCKRMLLEDKNPTHGELIDIDSGWEAHIFLVIVFAPDGRISGKWDHNHTTFVDPDGIEWISDSSRWEMDADTIITDIIGGVTSDGTFHYKSAYLISMADSNNLKLTLKRKIIWDCDKTLN